MLTMDYDDYWARGFVGHLEAVARQYPSRVHLVGIKLRKRSQGLLGPSTGIVGPSRGRDRGVGYKNREKKGPSQLEVRASRANRTPVRPTGTEGNMFYSKAVQNHYKERGIR